MGRRPADIEQFYDSQTLRKDVGARLKELRKELGINQRDVAKDINIDHVTLSKLENGKTELKLEYLYRLVEYFKSKAKDKTKCSIAYITGELQEYRTYTEKALCEQTGLDPEALRIMVNENKYKNDYPASRTFIRFINRIICDFHTNRKRDMFPINKIVGYINRVEDNNKIQLHAFFDDVIEVIRAYKKINRSAPHYEDVKKELANQGYSEKDLEIIKRSDYALMKYYDKFQNEDKRNLRIDIQDLFSDFMRGNFVEGKNHG